MISERITCLAQELVRGHSAPLYLLDLVGIEKQAAEFLAVFRGQFRDVLAAYSFKTNSLRTVTCLMNRLGLGAEVVSGAELSWALEDGFDASHIFFDGPLKTKEELTLAINAGVRIQVDSMDELQSIVSLAEIRKPLISARLSCKMEGRQSRFGFTAKEFAGARKWLNQQGWEFSGVHLHVGSNINDLNLYRERLASVEPMLREAWPALKCIDLGSGFPAASCQAEGEREPLEKYATVLKDYLEKAGLSLENKLLVVEPGRSLVEDHGYLLARVEVRKNRGGQRIVVTNGGLNLVSSMHRWHHPMAFLRPGASGGQLAYQVYGSNCFESDFLGVIHGPEDLAAGDWVIIGSAGGYDIPSANVWTRPEPPVYGIANDGKWRMIRRAQTVAEIRQRNTVP